MSYRKHKKEFCECCGHPGNFYPLDCDHIKTRKSGGSDNLDNIMTLCRKCHQLKGQKGIDYMVKNFPHYRKALFNRGWIKENDKYYNTNETDFN